MKKPIAIDLFCGLGGWTEGLLSVGYDVTGFDIEAHDYYGERYPARLVLQDVRTLHGSQFADADLIVASPPCQEFSYMAMPWSRARQIARALRGEGDFPKGYRGSRTVAELTALFDAAFRLQREASEAAGRRIPLVVENVKGAQAWVGPAAWNFGSYYLWGDVPALMPSALKVAKVPGQDWNNFAASGVVSPHWNVQGLKTNGAPHAREGEPHTKRLTNPAEHGLKNPGFRFDGSGRSFQSESVAQHVEEGGKFTTPQPGETKRETRDPVARTRTRKRKAASAKIAKIPFALSQWIAEIYLPQQDEAAA